MGPECESLQEGSKVRQQKTLNKAEKLNVMDRVKTFSSETTSIVAMAEVGHQFPFNASDKFKQFSAPLPVCSIRFLADGLKNQFMRLYEECATVADRYLKFQHKWHQHCSYYLVDCNRELSLIGLHPDDPIAVDVVSVRSQWHRVVKQYSLTKHDSKNFLILLVAVFTISCCILVIQPLRLVSLLHSHCPKTVMMCIIALEELLYQVCCTADIHKLSLVHYNKRREYC